MERKVVKLHFWNKTKGLDEDCYCQISMILSLSFFISNINTQSFLTPGQVIRSWKYTYALNSSRFLQIHYPHGKYLVVHSWGAYSLRDMTRQYSTINQSITLMLINDWCHLKSRTVQRQIDYIKNIKRKLNLIECNPLNCGPWDWFVKLVSKAYLDDAY